MNRLELASGLPWHSSQTNDEASELSFAEVSFAEVFDGRCVEIIPNSFGKRAAIQRLIHVLVSAGRLLVPVPTTSLTKCWSKKNIHRRHSVVLLSRI